MERITFNPSAAVTDAQLETLRSVKRDGAVKVLQRARILNIATGEGSKLALVTPPLKAKWGVSTEVGGQKCKPSLALEVGVGADNKPFVDAMHALDAAMRKAAVANAAELAPEPARRTAKSINKEWRPIIRSGKEDRFAPTITLKINTGADEKDLGDPEKWWVRVQDACGENLPKKKLKERNLLVVVAFEVKSIIATDTSFLPHLTVSRVCVLEELGGDQADDDVWGDSAAVTAAASRKRSREGEEAGAAE